MSVPEGNFIGDYELLFELGEGGMGKVFIAKHVQQNDLVAVKIPKSDVLERSGGSGAFLAEIRTASGLKHPSIVPIYTSGTALDGRLYFVMPLIEGGTLADAENRGKYRAPKLALALMLQIARAVQFAHERLVLHCDLKPANILLDTNGHPYVTDFGLARVIDKRSSAGSGGIRGGTVGWMSPEQEQLEHGDLTAASDVFSLGLLLKWLLGDEPPFGCGEDATPTEEVTPHRRSWLRGIEWELRAIAEKATQWLPERRYESAGEFARELERARDDHPIEAERHLPWRRVAKWVRRHRLATVGGIQLVLLLLYFALTPVSVLREVRSVIRERNEFAAAAQAGAVMNELRSFAVRVETLAVAPEVQALVEHSDVHTPPPALAAHRGNFDNLAVFELDGTLRARYPRPRVPYTKLNFKFRDYFRTLEQLTDRAPGSPPRAYVSRAFFSTSNGYLHIGFAAPMFDSKDRAIGVVLASQIARSTFGAVQMNCTGNGDCMTALLGLRDRDDTEQALPDAVNVVAQPGLGEGQDRVLEAAMSGKICAALDCVPRVRGQFSLPRRANVLVIDDYRDPVSNTQSIAALAPVGGTGLVVVVATREGAANALTARMIDRMKAFLWIPVLPGLMLLTALVIGPLLTSLKNTPAPGTKGSPRVRAYWTG